MNKDKNTIFNTKYKVHNSSYNFQEVVSKTEMHSSQSNMTQTITQTNLPL